MEGFFPINVPELRKRFVTADALPDDKKYLLTTPKHVRDGALDDLSIAFKTNLKIQKENPDHKFQISYRSRKESQSIVIPSTAIKLLLDSNDEHKMSMYPTYLKNKIKYHVRPRDARKGSSLRSVLYDCRLILDKLGRFYLCIPYSVPAHDSQVGSEGRSTWCSLDPGIRTFQTVYSPDYGIAYKLGDGDACRLHRLGRCLDAMISRHASLKGIRSHKRTRYRLRRAMERMRLRLKNLTKEVHWKVSHFLATRFKNIIIPPFQVSDMVAKNPKRRISAASVRKMLQWSHYAFRIRLMQKAVQHGCTVYVCTEEFTSKACTACMRVNPDLGAAKVFKCPHCGIRYDRDLGGSRNIFLKNTILDEAIIP